MTASFFIRFNRKEPYERISLGTEQLVYVRHKRNTIVAARYISEKSVDVGTKLSITIETLLFAECEDVEKETKVEATGYKKFYHRDMLV